MGSNGGQWDTVDLVGLTNAYPQFDKDPASFAQMMPQLQHAYYMQEPNIPLSQDLRIDFRRCFATTFFDRFLFYLCSDFAHTALPVGTHREGPRGK
jgi:hypothetical protein